jgi:hypothetical protein
MESVNAEIEAHLRTADYFRPHHGAGGFRTAAQVPARDGAPLRSLRQYARAGRGRMAGAGAQAAAEGVVVRLTY